MTYQYIYIMNEWKRLSVPVRVGKELREFIITSTGSELLSPGKNTVLWSLVRPWLRSEPVTGLEIRDPLEDIHIALRMKESNRIYSFASDKVTCINTCYTHFWLDPRGEAAVRRHFETSFRLVFHVYMAGYSAGSTGTVQLDAITSFCLDYGITVSEKLLQRLDKDWYRWRRKHGEDPVCPLLY